jgi:hypothetical protein
MSSQTMTKISNSENQDGKDSLPSLQDCLKILEPFPAGNAIYLLSVICPNPTCALELARVKFKDAAQRRESPPSPHPASESQQEEALAGLKAQFGSLPEEVARSFWITLAIAWINAYPPDAEILVSYKGENADRFKAAFLRTRLIDSILGVY